MLTPGRFPIWTQGFLALLRLPKPAGRHLGAKLASGAALEGYPVVSPIKMATKGMGNHEMPMRSNEIHGSHGIFWGHLVRNQCVLKNDRLPAGCH